MIDCRISEAVLVREAQLLDTFWPVGRKTDWQLEEEAG